MDTALIKVGTRVLYRERSIFYDKELNYDPTEDPSAGEVYNAGEMDARKSICEELSNGTLDAVETSPKGFKKVEGCWLFEWVDQYDPSNRVYEGKIQRIEDSLYFVSDSGCGMSLERILDVLPP